MFVNIYVKQRDDKPFAVTCRHARRHHTITCIYEF